MSEWWELFFRAAIHTLVFYWSSPQISHLFNKEWPAVCPFKGTHWAAWALYVGLTHCLASPSWILTFKSSSFCSSPASHFLPCNILWAQRYFNGPVGKLKSPLPEMRTFLQQILLYSLIYTFLSTFSFPNIIEMCVMMLIATCSLWCLLILNVFVFFFSFKPQEEKEINQFSWSIILNWKSGRDILMLRLLTAHGINDMHI